MASNRKSKQAQIDELQYRSSFYANIIAHLFLRHDIDILKVNKELFKLWEKSKVTIAHRVNTETTELEIMAKFD